MYNVKGPSKIVAKTRRAGLVQNIEVKSKKNNQSCQNNINNNNTIIHNNNEEIMVKGPKPVFQNSNKKLHQNGCHYHDYDELQVVTPQHEEIVNYVSNSWNRICSEMEMQANSSDGSSSPRSDVSVYYYEDDPVNLENFKPFDLESWWGKRLYTYITNSVNTPTS